MAIRDLFFNKKEPMVTPVIQDNKGVNSSINTFDLKMDFSNSIEPVYKTGRGYLFGINGYYPQELNDLYTRSPLHSAILNFKRLLTIGQGYEIDGLYSLDGLNRIAVNQLTNQFDLMISEITMDYYLHSRICIEVTWNADSTKIVKLERIAPEKIRIDEVNEKMQPISFLYNWDWIYASKYPTKKYPIYSQFNKKDKCQLFFFQIESPGMKLYSDPSYQSALNWVVLDSEMSEYHKSNIRNSINPSILIQFYEKPGSDEEKQMIVRELNNSFAGARKTGRSMITFSDGKDLSPTVTQMEANKLDKTFLSLTDTIQRQICYSHQIDPMLLGLKTPGSLGNSGEFLYSFNLFNASQIQPAQTQIENILNKFIQVNGLGVTIELNEPSIEKYQPIITP